MSHMSAGRASGLEAAAREHELRSNSATPASGKDASVIGNGKLDNEIYFFILEYDGMGSLCMGNGIIIADC